MNDVSRLLDELAYGDLSTPGTAATRDEWRRKGDESRLGSWTSRGQPRFVGCSGRPLPPR